MRGSVDTIKEKLDIREIVSQYVKLEKAGQSFKARCPFHNEKTPSFFVSPVRQSFYCFGCGAKGDIFTFVQEIEGLEFREALKFLAERAGVELEYQRGESKTEKDKLFGVLEEATSFFEKELTGNKPALAYITSRGINEETIKKWRIGYASGEWRLLYSHLQSLGYDKEVILKAGLVKLKEGGEPYDVFRDRIIFPLSDQNGRVIAFSGRAFSKETEPKYLNSPDTALFTKSEVLYGLDKAKESIRKQDYAVLVEGQMDLVLSHQAGVLNTVAASGTAFTQAHLERLRRLSSRIILAFDGDSAGEKAAEKASELGISLGFEVKVADVPEGEDPAEIVKKNPQEWKEVLRQSLPAVEFFFNKIEGKEKDRRKLGKQIEKKILPMIKLVRSAIEQSHFVSMLSKRTGIKEEILWEDLRRVERKQDPRRIEEPRLDKKVPILSQREQIEERLTEIELWRKELPESFKKEEIELMDNLSGIILHENLSQLSIELSRAEALKDNKLVAGLARQIQEVHGQIRKLEEKKKML
ncbi:MAG: DNA primase [Candidatus Zambryskibacteria bacterium RIFCSPLOWO2_12_FULL_45_14]|uniref:DNA primase n=1 Tax=Candidatus Zambryskibacteria bacterium RIFCSPLOWO2_12_FULL_45_14 TaxID=1802778 RepID=A0A1G2UVM2_9BACT|nr:MAG: DNA primase [Candidatus Zambryskibacteria bacterium RIFCSPLOWO2_12_FULL_45_14]